MEIKAKKIDNTKSKSVRTWKNPTNRLPMENKVYIDWVPSQTGAGPWKGSCEAVIADCLKTFRAFNVV